jgi:hypothetical protein
MKRFKDALEIQSGACNPSGIARALVRACDEARTTGGTPSNDPAIKLILHQMAFICGLPTAETLLDWQTWTKTCEDASCPSV